MNILVFGSLNMDKTYRVEHIVRPGETISAQGMETFCGGKGFNQAVALARAGNRVCFAGAVGEDGGQMLEALDRNGICRRHVRQTRGSTGHAIIQVDAAGQNSIMILAGANGEMDPPFIEKVLADFDRGDLIVLQNEVACVGEILRQAKGKGMTVAFNPSPCNEKIKDCDLGLVDYLLINETEGAAIAGAGEETAVLEILRERYPQMNVVLTLGERGCVYQPAKGERRTQKALEVLAVDTTAAGDTFTGYFLGEMISSGQAGQALRMAAAAAGISVTRQGAEPSIPYADEVRKACGEAFGG